MNLRIMYTAITPSTTAIISSSSVFDYFVKLIRKRSQTENRHTTDK